GQVVSVDEEELGIAGGRIVELQLLACEGLWHHPKAIVPPRCPGSKSSRSKTSISPPPRRCWPAATRDTGRRRRCCRRSPTSAPSWNVIQVTERRAEAARS